MPRLHSGALIDRPETTRRTLPAIAEVVWQQPPEKSAATQKLLNIHKDHTIETTQKKTKRLIHNKKLM